MISQINIRNLAVIEAVELDLAAGLTAITGETGAGKSIVVDALGLALGDRADAAAVRHGERRAEISVAFNLNAGSAALAWLEERMLDDGRECVIRRVVSAEGRSRAFVNGQQVTLQDLRQLGTLLVDIHGQHEHQSLLRADTQRAVLDSFAGLQDDAQACADAWQAWRDAAEELERLRQLAAEREDRLSLLRYQAEELAALDLEPGEPETLEEQFQRLAHTGQLGQGVQQALTAVYEADEGAAYDITGGSLRALRQLARLDESLEETCALLEQAEIQLSEAAAAMRAYLEALEIDPERQQEIEERLSAVRELARKHRVEERELPRVLPALEEQIAELEAAESRRGELEGACEAARSHYLTLAQALHEARGEAAARLSEEVTAAMQQLGMPGGRLQAEVRRLPEARSHAHGIDEIRLLVSANPGQPPDGLRRVASGGELSRISLALEVAAADAAMPATLVFDEVDSGVGGGVAEIVGRRLRELAGRAQVLCVTHLPQVASQAHEHVRISKLASGDVTRTRVSLLGPEERVEELARMLGGLEITETTRAHAAEMIEQARKTG